MAEIPYKDGGSSAFLASTLVCYSSAFALGGEGKSPSAWSIFYFLFGGAPDLERALVILGCPSEIERLACFLAFCTFGAGGSSLQLSMDSLMSPCVGVKVSIFGMSWASLHRLGFGLLIIIFRYVDFFGAAAAEAGTGSGPCLFCILSASAYACF